MKAVGLYRYLPIENEQALQDLEIAKPSVSGYDLLVKVNAVSVNPVDTKVRAPKEKVETSPRVLGWDAAGTVEAVGEQVTDFSVDDEVFYAGDITRSGSNAEYQTVDSRIVGKKPNNLTFSEAAALPLTSITAWESLFERLGISLQSVGNLLIIGGAGGVGSIAIQLAKKLTKLSVIATASRPETIAWCQALGADKVVNHRHDLVEQLNENSMNYILCLNDTQGHWQAMTQLIAPQGMICSIVESDQPLDMGPLKSKSAGFIWEFMFTRSMYQTEDMAKQGELLNELSALVEQGIIKSTIQEQLVPINAENLRKAHALIEQGNTIGKVVVSNK
ncbi:zinc-binding alcohol dehydrogenase family protein [Bowmanella denitrificans]|uniref:zinc-binding alcohol dehydrogenase family protein n=1 Tax=Bowmanella denitrificans TaxID=366582 RepID=UPI000C9989EE|nr:zinc-binding alcohol dehydrogenase family protein [Bowmanella denitrificans]